MSERTCSADDCQRQHYAHGWCKMHYGRWKRSVDKVAAGTSPLRMSASDRERFWAKVSPPDANGCRKWTGAENGRGYGLFHLNGRTAYAHRVAYVLVHGSIPEGLELDHVRARGCRSTFCVESDHLEPVTHEVNMERAAKTYCPHGHPYDEENTYVTPGSGKRHCRTCRKGAGPRNADKTHCKHGHEFTPENTRVEKNGRRQCCACLKRRQRERKLRRAQPALDLSLNS